MIYMRYREHQASISMKTANKNIYYAVSFATNREKANEQNKWNGGSA